MSYRLKDIVKSVEVTDTGIFLAACDKKFGVITDYLNGFSEEKYFEEEMVMFGKLKEYSLLETYDESWDFIENEFGGNILEAKEYGWISLSNYTPNLVIKREVSEFYLAYLLDEPFQPIIKIDLSNVKQLLTDWMEILRILNRR